MCKMKFHVRKCTKVINTNQNNLHTSLGKYIGKYTLFKFTIKIKK